MQSTPQGIGWIEVVCGPMFSGKTEELIRRVRRALYARQKVQIFKPRIDNRYHEVDVVSHSQQRVEAQVVDHAREIMLALDPDVSCVGIDEAQFFDKDLLGVVNACAEKGIRVIVAGLDQDFMGKPFEPMPELMAMAEYVTKMSAICVCCGNPASRTQRLSHHSSRVAVGASESYEARCRKCHDVSLGTVQEKLFVA
jgi:thymidine kinase